jgi:hypothetical protein
MNSSLKLGCIADDFTGATDLANNLVRAGMRVVQAIGVPRVPRSMARLSAASWLSSTTSTRLAYGVPGAVLTARSPWSAWFISFPCQRISASSRSIDCSACRT